MVKRSNNRECTTFLETLIQFMSPLAKIKGSSAYQKSYYEKMGVAIQQAHEAKEIDLACRPYVLYNLRTQFIKNSEPKVSKSELYQYNKYSEYAENVLAADFRIGQIFEAEKITLGMLDSYSQKMAHSAQVTKYEVSHIPKVIHSIWLTNPAKPKELFAKDIQNVIYNKKYFTSNDQNWPYVVWTNDKKLISKSVKTLEKNHIEVRSIYESQSPIKLLEEIKLLIDDNKFGMASDILRYEIIANEGGVYADLNFRFQQKLDSYLDKYDFISADFQNNFFAAKPHHIILEQTLETIKEHLIKLPAYIKDMSTSSTISLTHSPFVCSIVKYANSDDNHDFYHDYYYGYGLEDSGPLGEDNFGTGGTWKTEL